MITTEEPESQTLELVLILFFNLSPLLTEKRGTLKDPKFGAQVYLCTVYNTAIKLTNSVCTSMYRKQRVPSLKKNRLKIPSFLLFLFVFKSFLLHTVIRDFFLIHFALMNIDIISYPQI